MNLNVNDNPLLVAPRPVRVASAYPHFARSTHYKLVASPVEQSDHVKLSEDTEGIDEHKQSTRVDSSVSSDKDPTSPRASPRSSLPSEALEEFLSICMGWRCPSSPALRQRRNGAVSLPTFGLPYRSRSKMDFVHVKGDLSSIAFIEENERDPQTLYERDELGNFEIQDLDTQRCISPILYHLRYLVLAIHSYATHLMTSPSILLNLLRQSLRRLLCLRRLSPSYVDPDELVKVY